MQIMNPLALSLLVLMLTPFKSPEELVFAPKRGSSLTRTFREMTELELESVVTRIEGTEAESGEIEGVVRNEREITLTDVFLEVNDDRVLRLARTFDSLAVSTCEEGWEGGADAPAGEGKGTSELEGATVIFEWDEDGREYTSSYHEDCEGYDENLLGTLEGEVDLRRFLPQEDVSEGDTWKMEPEILVAVFQPGGDLTLGLDEVEPGDEAGVVAHCYFLCLMECSEKLDGEVKLEYEGLERIDDKKIAAVSFTAEISSSRDVLASMNSIAKGLDAEPLFFGQMDELIVDYDFNGEGKLLWNVETGCAHSLELHGELRVSLTLEDEEEETILEFRFAGTTEITVEVGME